MMLVRFHSDATGSQPLLGTANRFVKWGPDLIGCFCMFRSFAKEFIVAGNAFGDPK
jgi:hypothetical protein